MRPLKKQFNYIRIAQNPIKVTIYDIITRTSRHYNKCKWSVWCYARTFRYIQDLNPRSSGLWPYTQAIEHTIMQIDNGKLKNYNRSNPDNKL